MADGTEDFSGSLGYRIEEPRSGLLGVRLKYRIILCSPGATHKELQRTSKQDIRGFAG